MKRPMLFCALAGVCLCVLSFFVEKAAGISAVGIAMTIIVLILLRTDVKTVVIWGMIFAVALSLTGMRQKIARAEKLSGNTDRLQVTVTDPAQPTDNGWFVTVRVDDGAKDLCGEKIVLRHRGAELYQAERFAATVRFRSLERSAAKASYYADGIILSGDLLQIGEKFAPDPRLRTIRRIREYVADCFDRMFSAKEAQLFKALTVGDRSSMPESFRQAAAYAGVSHVLVISGMHFAIMMGALFGLLDALCYNRYLRAAVVLIAVLCLAAVCGFTKSVLRAGVTYLLMALGQILRRDGEPVNLLSATVVLILIGSPFAIFDLSLQLSLLATFGVLVAARVTRKIFPFSFRIWHKIKRAVFSVFCSTTFAMVMTLPVAVWHFGFISWIAPLTNLLIAYAVTWMLTLAMFGLALTVAGLPFLARPLFLPAGAAADYTDFVIRTLGASEKMTVPLGRGAMPAAVGIALLTAGIYFACDREKNDVLKERRESRWRRFRKRL